VGDIIGNFVGRTGLQGGLGTKWVLGESTVAPKVPRRHGPGLLKSKKPLLGSARCNMHWYIIIIVPNCDFVVPPINTTNRKVNMVRDYSGWQSCHMKTQLAGTAGHKRSDVSPSDTKERRCIPSTTRASPTLSSRTEPPSSRPAAESRELLIKPNEHKNLLNQ
jgi:hypothetical protein